MQVSAREFEIAEQVALGKSKKEAACKLNLSVYTIETTIKNVYEKEGFNKIQDLVLWYIGIKLKISEEIKNLKEQVVSDNASKQIIILLFISILCIDGYHEMQYRIRRYRRENETESVSPIDYLITA